MQADKWWTINILKTMKALSIRQPWAWLIATGKKQVENRTWRTHYRGTVAIQASRWDNNSPYRYGRLLIPNELWTGCIIGFVDIVDVVTVSERFGQYQWILKNAKEIEPVECSGKLGIFEIDEEIFKGK